MKRISVCFFVLLLASCVLVEDYFMPAPTPKTDFERGIAAFDMANYQTALDYLSGPAEHGDADAQYLVGMIYMYGLAGTKNSYMAQKWLTLAADSGQRAAQEQLAFLYRDELTPLYNPINAYHWFSIIIEDKPQYRGKLQNLEWTLRSRGLLSTAQSMPRPKEKLYKGVNYNSLFPLR
ncbi:MAG: sel1 repeat family protein [Alphaproteobacteria bacterium]|nr:sel1 repeat family protein [Alphaproteobacteria bacterium]